MSHTHTPRGDLDARTLLRGVFVALTLVAAAVASVLVFEPRPDAFDAASQAFASEADVTPYPEMSAPPEAHPITPSPVAPPLPEPDNHPPTF